MVKHFIGVFRHCILKRGQACPPFVWWACPPCIRQGMGLFESTYINPETVCFSMELSADSDQLSAKPFFGLSRNFYLPFLWQAEC